MIFTPLQKLPNNVGDLDKLIVARGFKKLPKVQKIANSGHTAPDIGLWAVAKNYVNIKQVLIVFDKRNDL